MWHYLGMKTPYRSSARHFPYKHPLFGTKNSRKTGANSVYYWWWAYLKRNKDYLACCESGGKGRLAELYADFGDVRSDDFKAWWEEGGRGVRLFAEPPAEELVRVLSGGDVVPDVDVLLTVSFPMNFPKRYLMRRFADLLEKTAHSGKRGYQYAKNTQARYKIVGQPNIPALKRALAVYDRVEQAKLSKPKKPYWKIAAELRLVPPEKLVLPTDSKEVAEEKRNIMTAIVGRLKRRAASLIKASSSKVLMLGESS